MPSTTSSSVSSDLASSTVMTPSLPTFFMASARNLPISASPLAEMVPTWAISSFDVTFGVLDEVRNDGFDREVDTALQVHRVHAGGNRLGAFAHDRLGQHGGGGGAVAGRVSGLRSDFAHHLRAHVLELVLELDLLGDSDAVLGDAGSAERLVEHDVAALRTERDLHCVGENVDAAKHLVARIDGEFDFFSCHLDFSLGV